VTHAQEQTQWIWCTGRVFCHFCCSACLLLLRQPSRRLLHAAGRASVVHRRTLDRDAAVRCAIGTPPQTLSHPTVARRLATLEGGVTHPRSACAVLVIALPLWCSTRTSRPRTRGPWFMFCFERSTGVSRGFLSLGNHNFNHKMSYNVLL
jgi:hypothetical protein